MECEANRPGGVRVKICGLRRGEDAALAVRSGADAVGFVFAESPRRVTVDEAALAAAAARGEASAAGRNVEAWGVVVNEPVERLHDIARRVPLDVIQLHGDETPELARELTGKQPQMHADARRSPGGVRLVKAVRVRDAASLDEIERLWGTGLFEAILLDAFVAPVASGASVDGSGPRGGTGRTFDWDVARAAAERVPVVLAGGLTPENVAEAVRIVRPWMVDTSSGVESSRGVKDASLIERFVREAKYATANGSTAKTPRTPRNT